MEKLFIEDLDLKGARVLMRVDFNVPLDADGRVADDSRIRAALPSIEHVLGHGGKLVLMSHLGRPKGRPVPSMSLAPAAARLGELIGKPVRQLDDCVGPEVEAAVAAMAPGDAVMLENLRFHPEEEKNDPVFSKALAALGDLYVNDAFGTAHRAHASTVGVTRFLPRAAAGFLMRDELEYLGKLLSDPARPFVAILGGAKISTKIAVIESLLRKADRVLIGGAMSYTLLEAQGARRRLARGTPDARDRPRDAGGGVAREGAAPPSRGPPHRGEGRGGEPAAHRRTGRDTRRLDRGGHRAAHRRLLRGGDRRRAHDLLERADGRLRGAGVRRRDARDRAAGRGVEGVSVIGGGTRWRR